MPIFSVARGPNVGQSKRGNEKPRSNQAFQDCANGIRARLTIANRWRYGRASRALRGTGLRRSLSGWTFEILGPGPQPRFYFRVTEASPSDNREQDRSPPRVGAVPRICSNRRVTLLGNGKRAVSDLILNFLAIRTENTLSAY